jgi:outer membrane receptor for ferrienterochelin and colicins
MNRIIPVLMLMLIAVLNGYAQKPKSDAHLIGHVTSKGLHIPFAGVYLKGTSIGTVSDATGHYQLLNLPPGQLTVVVQVIGYKTLEKSVLCELNKTIELKFELEEDVLNLEEVVVSADRSEQKRTEAPVIVSTLSKKLFNASQSVSLGDGLNFSPGLRLENNCQNCGFTQVRMNGMEGPYTQILINSRPIFSGLAGVYGLELIPVNMIEKVEVVRGGGSALYGSNAIAGTINILLKDPVINTWEAGVNYSYVGAGIRNSGGAAPDYSINLNTSMVTDDQKSGMSLYGFSRKRRMFDANADGFSEIAPMSNLTLGGRVFHRTGSRGKLAADFFSIREARDGGNRQDLPLHERDVAEAVAHDMNTAALTFERYLREYDLLSFYASGQLLHRDSYYGANKSLKDYGETGDKTYNTGVQYKAVFDNSSMVMGIENTGGFLLDKKMSYPDFENAVILDDSIVEIPHSGNTIVANQHSLITGAFIQYELKLENAKVSVGARFDHYEVGDRAKEDREAKRGEVFSPRISLMYNLADPIQLRAGYSKGFRAPQIFDEDLHIETSGSRQVINENDPDLKQESSHSFTASLDFNGRPAGVYTGFLVEGFYTRLIDPFVNEIGVPDGSGTVIYRRVNAEEGAMVKGVNMEFKLKPLNALSLSSGFTVQMSHYDVVQEFEERRFFRTPGRYGYFAFDWDFAKDLCLSATGNYTGSMLVPYFGPDTDPEAGELRVSDSFFDAGFKIKQVVQINGAAVEWFAGVKNVLNSYQRDFDMGIDRDPAYMYGPVSPRTVYFGLKFGNFLGR